MKSAKEFITARIDDLALQYHNKFYCDLPRELQEVIWIMANRDWVDYYSGVIDSTYDRIKEELPSREQMPQMYWGTDVQGI